MKSYASKTKSHTDKVVFGMIIVLFLALACCFATGAVAETDANADSQFNEEYGDFIYTASGTDATITGLTATGLTKTELIIPDIIDPDGTPESGDELTVVAIENGALDGNVATSITSSIGSYESTSDGLFLTGPTTYLYKGRNLNVQTIYGAANAKLASTTSLVINPGEIQLIPEGYFAGNTKLESFIAVDYDVTTVFLVMKDAFRGCTKLGELDIVLNATPEATDVPILEVGETAFEGASLTSVVLYAYEIDVGNKAFANTESLSSVEIWGNAAADYGNITIGNGVFTNSGVETVRIEIQNVGDVSVGAITVGKSAFEGCSRLTSVQIGDRWDDEYESVEIKSDAFKDCISLTKLIFNGSSIQSFVIGEHAFQNTTKLTTVEMDAAKTVNIGESAFVGSGIKGISVTADEDLDSSVNILIGESAFNGCENLASVFLEAPVISVEAYAFYGCDIKSFGFDAELMENIGQYAFANNVNLNTISNSGDGPRRIMLANGAFSGCIGLSYVTLDQCADTAVMLMGTNESTCSVPTFDGAVNIQKFYVSSLVATGVSMTNIKAADMKIEVLMPMGGYGIANAEVDKLTITAISPMYDDFALGYMCPSIFSNLKVNTLMEVGIIYTNISSFKDETVKPIEIPPIFDGCTIDKLTIEAFDDIDGGLETDARYFVPAGFIANNTSITTMVMGDGTGKFIFATDDVVEESSIGSLTFNSPVEFYNSFTLWEASADIAEVTSFVIGSAITDVTIGTLSFGKGLLSTIDPEATTATGYMIGGAKITSINFAGGTSAVLLELGSRIFKHCEITNLGIGDYTETSALFLTDTAVGNLTIGKNVTVFDNTFGIVSSWSDVKTRLIKVGDKSVLYSNAFSGSYAYVVNMEVGAGVTLGEMATPPGEPDLETGLAVYKLTVGEFAIIKEGAFFSVQVGVPDDEDTGIIEFGANVTIPDADITTAIPTIFGWCGYLREISFGNNATIGNYAFTGCELLSTVTFAGGAIDIGDYSFSGTVVDSLTLTYLRPCIGLTKIDFGEMTKLTIGDYAFAGCGALSVLDIEIPSSVTSDGTIKIGKSAFSAFYGKVSDGVYDEYLMKLKKITIETFGTITIDDYAFAKNRYLTSISIESTRNANDYVITINEGAFSDVECTGAVSITASNGGIIVNNGAFSPNENGTSPVVTYEKSVLGALTLDARKITIGSEQAGPDYDEKLGAFYLCEMASLTVNGENVSIASFAFYETNIKGLVDIDADCNDLTIGLYSFCLSKLTHLDIYNTGDIHVGSGAFSGCTALVDAVIESEAGDVSVDNLAFAAAQREDGSIIVANLGSIEINANGKVVIGKGAFLGDKKLLKFEITAYNDVTIKELAFSGVGTSVKTKVKESSITSIGGSIIVRNSAFGPFVFSSEAGVMPIFESAVLGALTMEAELNITIADFMPKSVNEGEDYVPSGAFYGTTIADLKITFGSKLDIGKRSFESSTVGKAIMQTAENVDGDSIDIDSFAFVSSSIIELTIDADVNSVVIGAEAFYNTQKLEKVSIDVLDGSVEIDQEAFSIFYNAETLSFKTALKSIEISATDNIDILEGAFYGGTVVSVLSLISSEGTITIGEFAFTGCGQNSSSVNTANIEADEVIIGSLAFSADIIVSEDFSKKKTLKPIIDSLTITADEVSILTYDWSEMVPDYVDPNDIDAFSGAFCGADVISVIINCVNVFIDNSAFHESGIEELIVNARGSVNIGRDAPGSYDVLPTNLMELGAFRACEELSNVSITAKGDIVIGEGSFRWGYSFNDDPYVFKTLLCSMDTLYLKGNNIYVGDEAFAGCESLVDITIENSREFEFGSYVFAGTGLVTEFVYEGNADVEILRGMFGRYIYEFGDSTSPFVVKHDWANIEPDLGEVVKFEGVEITEISINTRGEVDIDDYAFLGCNITGVVTINGRDGVSIGKAAFFGTEIDGLTIISSGKVDIHSGPTSDRLFSRSVSITYPGAFGETTINGDVEIKGSPVAIGSGAFINSQMGNVEITSTKDTSALVLGVDARIPAVNNPGVFQWATINGSVTLESDYAIVLGVGAFAMSDIADDLYVRCTGEYREEGNIHICSEMAYSIGEGRTEIGDVFLTANNIVIDDRAFMYAFMGKVTISNDYGTASNAKISLADEAFRDATLGDLIIDGNAVSVTGGAFAGMVADEVTINATSANDAIVFSDVNDRTGEFHGAFEQAEMLSLKISAPNGKIIVGSDRDGTSGRGMFSGADVESVVFESGISIEIGSCAFAPSADLDDGSTVYSTVKYLSLVSGDVTIYNGAFLRCKSLTETTITASSSVSIWPDAFSECGSTLADSFKILASETNGKAAMNVYISDDAFGFYDGEWTNTYLGNVTIDTAGAVTIYGDVGSGAFENGIGAFTGCVIDDLVINAGSVNIGKKAFYGYSDEIPTKVKTVTITTTGGNLVIDESAFQNVKDMSELDIEVIGDVTIGDYAFADCLNLKKVEIHATGKVTISKNAFSTTALPTGLPIETLTIESDDEIIIDKRTYADCKNLHTVSIEGKKGVTIGEYAFEGCGADVSETTKVTYRINGGSEGEYGIKVENNAFTGANVGYITFESVKSIEFADATSIELGSFCGATIKDLKVDGGDTVTIGKYSVNSTSAEIVALKGKELNVGVNSFVVNESLTEVTLEATDKITVSSYAFAFETVEGVVHYDASIKKLVMESDVIDIQNFAFAGCKGLTWTSIVANNVTVGENAFSGCGSAILDTESYAMETSVFSIYVPEENPIGITISNKAFANYTIREGDVLENAAAFIFMIGGDGYITVKDSADMELGAFTGFNSEQVVFSTNAADEDGKISIGTYSFVASKVKRVLMNGYSVTVGKLAGDVLESGAFYNSEELISLYLSTGDGENECRDLRIGLESFVGCKNLASVTLVSGKEGNTYVGESAFEGDEELSELTAQSGGNLFINAYAFYGCKQLGVEKGESANDYVRLSSVDNLEINANAFSEIGYGYDSAKDTLCPFSISSSEGSVLINVGAFGKFDIGAREDLDNASVIGDLNISALNGHVIILGGLTEYGQKIGAFYMCEMGKVTITGNDGTGGTAAVSIGEFAFFGSGADSLTINSEGEKTTDIVSISMFAFYSSSVESVEITVQRFISIDTAAFQACESLESVYIMNYDSISIYSGAFSVGVDPDDGYSPIFNDALTDIFIDANGGNLYIYEGAFAGARCLQRLYISAYNDVTVEGGAFAGCGIKTEFDKLEESKVISLNGNITINDTAFGAFIYLNEILFELDHSAFGDLSIVAPGNITIGSTVELPEEDVTVGAFYQCVMGDLTINGKGVTIGNAAFYGAKFKGGEGSVHVEADCEKLLVSWYAFAFAEMKDVELLNTDAITIRDLAFAGCEKLETVGIYVNGNVHIYNGAFASFMNSDGDYVIEGLEYLTISTFGDVLVGERAFLNNKYLEGFTISTNGNITIRDGAFSGIGTEVEEPSDSLLFSLAGDIIIDDRAFGETLYDGEALNDGYSVLGGLDIWAVGNITIGSTVELPEEDVTVGAFYQCVMGDLTINGKGVTIGNAAFFGAIFNDGEGDVYIEADCEKLLVSWYAFAFAEMKDVELLNTDAITIRDLAFAGCAKLETVDIYVNGDVHIYNGAFASFMNSDGDYVIEGLKSVRISSIEGEILIGEHAFLNNKHLEKFELGATLGITIKSGAFSGIGTEVEEFGYSYIICMGDLVIEDRAFGEAYDETYGILSDGFSFLGNLAISSGGNVTIGNVHDIPDEEKTFGAFYGCTMGNLLIGGVYVKVNEYAFYEATIDSDLTITSSANDGTAVNLAKDAFGMTSIENVTITANGMINVGYEAFYGCENLDTVKLESYNSSVSVGFAAFSCSIDYVGGEYVVGDNHLATLDINASGNIQIWNNAFLGRAYLEKFVIDALGFVEICGGAFAGIGTDVELLGESTVTAGDYVRIFDNAFGEFPVGIDVPLFPNSALGDLTITASEVIIGNFDAGESTTATPEEGAFFQCEMGNLTINGEGVDIGNFAFYGATIDNSVTINADGSVVAVWRYAFALVDNLETLDILSSGNVVLKTGAFTGCEDLLKAEIESEEGNVELSIGVFSSYFIDEETVVVEGLETVSITALNGKVTVGDGAFCGDANLEKFEIIADGDIVIKENAFSGVGTAVAETVKDSSIASSNGNITIRDTAFGAFFGVEPFISEDPIYDYSVLGNLTITAEGDVVIGSFNEDGMPTIAPYEGAFYQCEMKDLIIDGENVDVGDYAFFGATIDMHAKITADCETMTIWHCAFQFADIGTIEAVNTGNVSIRTGAFSGCENLFRANISSIEGYVHLSDGAFSFYVDEETGDITAGGLEIVEIRALNGDVIIGAGAFCGNVKLERFEIRAGEDIVIKENAFSGVGIEAETVGDDYIISSNGDVTIRDTAFGAFAPADFTLYSHSRLGNLTIGAVNGTVEIEGLDEVPEEYPVNGAFYECVLNDLVINAKKIHVGIGAFFKSKVVSVTLFSTSEEEDALVIGEYAFFMCSELESISIDIVGGIEIKYATFAACEKLANVSLVSDKFVKIGAGAFEWTYTVKEDHSFDKFVYTPLETLNIEAPFSEIGEEAFCGCEKLRFVTITVDDYLKIAKNAFSGCGVKADKGKLDKGFYIYGTEETDDGAFIKIANDAFGIYSYTDDIVESHVYDKSWFCTIEVEFNGDFTVIGQDDIEEIPAGAFTGCATEKPVVIIANKVDIGYSAFAFSGINGLLISGAYGTHDEGTVILSANSFMGSESLAIVNITKANIINIYGMAFVGCTSLTNVVAESTGLVYIGEGAFQSMPMEDMSLIYDPIETISLKGDTVMIDVFAFLGCELLDYFNIEAETHVEIGCHAFRGCGFKFGSLHQASIIDAGEEGTIHIGYYAFGGEYYDSFFGIEYRNTVLGDLILEGGDIFIDGYYDYREQTYIGQSDPSWTAEDYIGEWTPVVAGDLGAENGAFYLCEMGALTISGGNVTIGGLAFFSSGIDKLDIYVTGDVDVGMRAFTNCTQLVSVSIVSDDGDVTVQQRAFSWYAEVQEVEVPDEGIKKLYVKAINPIENTFVWAGGEINILTGAFCGCELLVSETVYGVGGINIGKWAFAGCGYGPEPQDEFVISTPYGTSLLIDQYVFGEAYHFVYNYEETEEHDAGTLEIDYSVSKIGKLIIDAGWDLHVMPYAFFMGDIGDVEIHAYNNAYFYEYAFWSSNIDSVKIEVGESWHGGDIAMGPYAFANNDELAKASIDAYGDVEIGYLGYEPPTVVGEFPKPIPGLKDDAFVFIGCPLLEKFTVEVDGYLVIGNYSFGYSAYSENPADDDSPLIFVEADPLIELELNGDMGVSIDEGAFMGCDKLVKVAINTKDLNAKTNDENLTAVVIGPYAFTGTTALSEFVINCSEGNVSIQNGLYVDEVEMTEYLYAGGSFASFTAKYYLLNTDEWFYKTFVASAIKVFDVTTTGDIYIDDMSFYSCPNLTTVALCGDDIIVYGESSMVDIYGEDWTPAPDEHGAFAHCGSLRTFTYNDDSDIILGPSAFYDCDGFGYFAFDTSGEVFVGRQAFYDCGGLTTLEFIGCYEVYISPMAYQSCAKLAKVGFYGCGQVWIENAEYDYEGAFEYNKALKTVEFNAEAGAFVGSYAFYGCTGLTDLSFADGTTTIDRFAFAECTGLTTLVFMDTYETILREGAFSGCTSLEILVSGSITEIGEGAFAECVNLESVMLLNTIDKRITVGPNAFEDCVSLEVAIIGDFDVISENAFFHCKSLTYVLFTTDVHTRAGTVEDGAFYLSDGSREVVCDIYTTGWGEKVFADEAKGGPMTKLVSHVYGIGVIGDFEDIFYLYDGDSGVLTVTSLNEHGNTTLTTLPSMYVYGHYAGATKLVIGEGISKVDLGGAAFGISTIEEIEFGKDVTVIGAESFNQWKNLKSITLPENIRKVGERAFFGCSSVSMITIEGDINKMAFEHYSFNLAGDDIGKTVRCRVASEAGADFLNNDYISGEHTIFHYGPIEPTEPSEGPDMMLIVIAAIAVVAVLLLGVFCWMKFGKKH